MEGKKFFAISEEDIQPSPLERETTACRWLAGEGHKWPASLMLEEQGGSPCSYRSRTRQSKTAQSKRIDILPQDRVTLSESRRDERSVSSAALQTRLIAALIREYVRLYLYACCD